jgi:hypothetical protein
VRGAGELALQPGLAGDLLGSGIDDAQLGPELLGHRNPSVAVEVVCLDRGSIVVGSFIGDLRRVVRCQQTWLVTLLCPAPSMGRAIATVALTRGSAGEGTTVAGRR